MGRFSDDGNYTKDITEGTLSNVRQIRIADFIKTVVATRRWIVDFFLFCAIVDLLRFDSSSQVPTQHPPSVVMKLDVEGRFI